jgi:hypothetical protein
MSASLEILLLGPFEGLVGGRPAEVTGPKRHALLALRGGRMVPVEVLAEELGVEPGPGLQRLQAAILAHDPALASVPAAVAPRGRLPAPVTSLVGRQQALAEVVELVGGHRLMTLPAPVVHHAQQHCCDAC